MIIVFMLNRQKERLRRTHLLIGRVWQMPRRLNGKIFIFRRVVFIGHK